MNKINLFKTNNPISALKICSLFVLLIAAGRSEAQNGFDIGLRTVIQKSSLINKQDQATGHELDYKLNWHVAFGLGADYTFSKHFGAGIDLLFSKQGEGYKGTTITGADPSTLYNEFQGLAAANSIPFSGAYTADITISTMKIPFMLRYTGNSTKKYYFSSFIGPQIDMISKVVVKVNGTEAKFTSLGIKPEDVYKKTTMDAVLGLGAGMNLNKNLVLTAGLRLDYGLGDVEKKDATFSNGTQKFYPVSRTSTTNNATGGLWISLNYKFVKKAPEKPAVKGKQVPKKK